MWLYPAIDLRDGRCVRLLHGDFAQETVYGDDPVAQAQQFADAGSAWIHMVDLDAARTGQAHNREVIQKVAATVRTARVQTGGGVRTDDDVSALIDAGVGRVVIGTAALEDPAFVERSAERYPGQVAVGLDIRGREVAVRGWVEGSGRDLFEVAEGFADAGVAALIVTQILVDGSGDGPDVDSYRALLEATELEVVASGGVGTLDHIRTLADLDVGGRTLDGVIVGRALYEGAFTIDEALAAANAL
jgi:phosphoribosylformimino-5-aminoimidazole carboxamide ribotide isomerase